MKPNYFTIHKNKKPIRLFKKINVYKSYLTAKTTLISAMGALEASKIQSQVMPKYMQGSLSIETAKAKKEAELFNSIINTSNAIINAFKDEHLNRFKQTGRYGRKRK